MVQTIRELQDAQVEPDIWKIEGLDRPEDCERIVAAARRDGREKVGCIILGRGEDEQQVRKWLTVAAGVEGFIGFAVGRTDFWDPLVAWRSGKATRDAAVAEMARHYREPRRSRLNSWVQSYSMSDNRYSVYSIKILKRRANP
jgi:5-dehydro-2-deoxygluconokinase